MEKSQQWDEEAPVNAAMIEQYKAWWKKHGFPRVDLIRDSRIGVEGLNEPRHQPTNEQWLWVAMLKEAIDDFHKTSTHWKKPCHECHMDQPCGHVKYLYPRNENLGKARIGLAGRPTEWENCPYFHNQQQCAATWLAGPDCEEVCNWLGIDVEYFRKQVGV